jgi:hypothetical protein
VVGMEIRVNPLTKTFEGVKLGEFVEEIGLG